MSSDTLLFISLGAGGAAMSCLAVWAYLRLGWRMARPVVAALPPPDVRRIAHEALRQFHLVGGRVWGALLRGALLIGACAAVVSILGGGVFAAAAWGRMEEATLTFDGWMSIPAVGRYAGYFVAIGLMACFLISLVFACRVVLLVKEGRSTRWRSLSKEFDRAVDHGGVLATLAFGAAILLLAAGWLTLWGVTGSEIGRRAGWAPGLGRWAGLCVGGALGWFVSLQAMFTFPVLAVRDPGWLSALEASIGMMVLRPGAALRAGLWVTLLSPTIYYWPAALGLLLDFIDDQFLLITVLLRERQPRDAMRDLEDQAPAREETLLNADRLIRSGRYLDALNQYQIFYYKNAMSAPALEGIARAQFCIGNRQKAKEALERLLVIDSSHRGGALLMTEFQQGLWDENGPLFQEARQRCTQILGKGVELRDVLDPALVRQFESRNEDSR